MCMFSYAVNELDQQSRLHSLRHAETLHIFSLEMNVYPPYSLEVYVYKHM
jgi:hypothetical protein